ncbi:hypothetical protein ABE504_09795 [Paenibacillus oryzisoli]|uniref:hypothetical protein n=1 Tax=Paenibacillus oryzisoli TaxID=1850517 RepID=UPI003D2B6364
MEASIFNPIFNEVVTKKLQEYGYLSKGQCLYKTKGETVAALLRRTYRGDQGTNFIFCIRHRFVRDLKDLQTKNIYLKDAIDYPFRIAMVNFKEEDLFGITYEPINYLRPSEIGYEGIYYGDIPIEDTDKIVEKLNRLTNNIINYEGKIINLLTPQRCQDLIEKKSTGAFIERMWIEDYKNFLEN